MLNHGSMFSTLSGPLFMLSEFGFYHSCYICVCEIERGCVLCFMA